VSSRSELRRLRRRRVPAWWSDAKLGIFVHWTPASVVGWAPVDVQIGDLIAAGRPDALGSTPYTEWYQNSLRFPGSPASEHHRRVHGGCDYEVFVDAFEAGLAEWDPDDWARRFAATGARYVVLVAKHHDGFCLWPTGVAQPTARRWHTERDVVGELREAVLGAGMRFGVYYSGGLDWTFDDRPIGNLGDLLAAVPRGAYPAYAAAQVRELIDRYRPSVLWNDIAWPAAGGELWPLFAEYYRAVPDGVVNDRWLPWSPAMGAMQSAAVRRLADSLNARVTRRDRGIVPPRPPHFDVRTPEYTVFPDVPRDPWECVRGMDHSFGFNRASTEEHFIGHEELLGTFADIVAKGGNLLLNVGPKGEDASIPDEQAERLAWLGEWTSAGGCSVVGSRPWVTPELSGGGLDWRTWVHDRSVFAALVGGDGADGPLEVRLPGVRATPTTTVRLVRGPGVRTDVEWVDRGGVVGATLPADRGRLPVLELLDVDAAGAGR
jgi:alpha-L-fucosidase